MTVTFSAPVLSTSLDLETRDVNFIHTLDTVCDHNEVMAHDRIVASREFIGGR